LPPTLSPTTLTPEAQENSGIREEEEFGGRRCADRKRRHREAIKRETALESNSD